MLGCAVWRGEGKVFKGGTVVVSTSPCYNPDCDRRAFNTIRWKVAKFNESFLMNSQ